MNVTFKLMRRIPHYKAVLMNQPECTDVFVEADIWECETEEQEPLAELFAGLKENGSAEAFPKNGVFILPPKYRENPNLLMRDRKYCSNVLRIELPVVYGDQNPQEVFDGFIADVRQAYIDGYAFGAKIQQAILALPLEAWGKKSTLHGKYHDAPRADDCIITEYDFGTGISAIEKNLGLPDYYLCDVSVHTMLRSCAEIVQACRVAGEYHDAKYPIAVEQMGIQNAERQAKIAAEKQAKEEAIQARRAEEQKLAQVQKAALESFLLSHSTEIQRERYHEGFMGQEEQRDILRHAVFADAPFLKFSHIKKSGVCSCSYVTITHEPNCDDHPLTDAEFIQLKKIREFFNREGYKVSVVGRQGKCAHTKVSATTALVTWTHPGLENGLSREYWLDNNCKAE